MTAITVRTIATVLAVCCLMATASATTPEKLGAEAVEAMNEDRYEQARKLLEESLESRPGDAVTLYNLACCLSRTGDLRQAGKHLEEAWEAGFRNVELLRTDPDLEALRASKRGGTLVARLIEEEEELQRLRGTPILFEAPMLGSMRVVTPPTMKLNRRYPLVVILHGHGANPEHYAGLFDRVESGLEAIVCAVYGPYPIALPNGHGYSWYPPPWLFRDVLATGISSEDRDVRRSEIVRAEQSVTNRHVLAAIESVKNSYPVDEKNIFLLGHSEGGVLAYSLGLEKSDLFEGLIVVGSRLRELDASRERLAAAGGHLRILICHSRQDEQISFDQAQSAQRTLRDAGIDSRLVAYPGGHSLTASVFHTAARWILNPKARLGRPASGPPASAPEVGR